MKTRKTLARRERKEGWNTKRNKHTRKQVHKSRVSDENGVSLLYIMLEIHHSGREPWKCKGNMRKEGRK